MKIANATGVGFYMKMTNLMDWGFCMKMAKVMDGSGRLDVFYFAFFFFSPSSFVAGVLKGCYLLN